MPADSYLNFLTQPYVRERMKDLDSDIALRAIVQYAERNEAPLQKAAPSRGYAPYLIEQGADPVWAHRISTLIVDYAVQFEREARWMTEVARSLRFIAKSTRTRKSIAPKVYLLVKACERTTIIEALLAAAGVDEYKFLTTLQSVVNGDERSYPKLVRLAAPLIQFLPTRRGPKASAKTIAHEMFLERIVAPLSKTSGYTWNLRLEDFTDACTLATRREFADPDFDPRPARRRMKANASAPSAPRAH